MLASPQTRITGITLTDGGGFWRNLQTLFNGPRSHCFAMWWYAGKAQWTPRCFTNARTLRQSNVNIIRPLNVRRECGDLSAEKEGKSPSQICHCGVKMFNRCSEKLSNSPKIDQSGSNTTFSRDSNSWVKFWYWWETLKFCCVTDSFVNYLLLTEYFCPSHSGPTISVCSSTPEWLF